MSKMRHFLLGKIAGWHIFHSGKRIISLNFQDKEEVESVGLKLVESGCMEEASLHSIPSRGHNYRGVVARDGRRGR